MASPVDVPQKSILLGIILTILSGSFLAMMDAISKHLMGSLDSVQVIWSRYFFQALVVTVYLLATRSRSIFKSARPGIQLRRSAALFGATFAMYSSLQFLPLADASAVQFMAPVLVTIISGVFLKEAIGVRRYSAVFVAFCGVLLIVQPGGDFQWPILLPLFTALMMAIFLIQTRELRLHDDDYTTLFYSTLVGVIVLILIVPFFWQHPSLKEFLMMCAQGSLGAVGHLMLIKGFKHASASVLSPFLYSQLLVAVILSVTVLADPMTIGIFAGACLIVASGLYIWHREVYLTEHRKTAT
ncbi:MAG: DMT family transporter [Rhodospirillaceae bacterium]|jgi:drug/metabolite transporter (DMT)-like permease|nr:DMT family transporter [Rhodospirillaceae bacterium]MBT4588989.1 DMT family transporter [Rhodospirillaceae bacterium]MBT5941951.1 DMT family transporter [Rhodospirillaceae bacterium]MBT7268356.1 DMT family transporter [Rhodospirillaceae bacterium]